MIKCTQIRTPQIQGEQLGTDSASSYPWWPRVGAGSPKSRTKPRKVFKTGFYRGGTHQSRMAPKPAETLPWLPGVTQLWGSSSAALRDVGDGDTGGCMEKTLALSSVTCPGPPKSREVPPQPPPQSLLEMLPKTTFCAKNGQQQAQLPQIFWTPPAPEGLEWGSAFPVLLCTNTSWRMDEPLF